MNEAIKELHRLRAKAQAITLKPTYVSLKLRENGDAQIIVGSMGYECPQLISEEGIADSVVDLVSCSITKAAIQVKNATEVMNR